jgi:hypothetical protein
VGDLAGGPQLAPGALGERFHAHRGEHLVGGAQLLARVQAAAFAAQPFAVDEVSAGERDANAGASEPLDRLAIRQTHRRTGVAQPRADVSRGGGA